MIKAATAIGVLIQLLREVRGHSHAGTVTCNAGKRLLQTNCAGDNSTCNKATCCEGDPWKCSGIGGITCLGAYYVSSITDDVSVTQSTKNSACCTAKAVCTGFTSCASGYKLKSSPDTIMGTGGTSTLSSALCCEIDNTRCRGLWPITCQDSTYYVDSNKYGATATASNKNTNICCSAKATCAGYSCLPGYTLNSNPASIRATGGVGTLSNSLCCTIIASTCAGIGGIACPSGYYQDPAKHGNSATATDRNYQCCTAKTACSSWLVGNISCAAGYNSVAIHCTGGSSSCDTSACCELDPWKCAGIHLLSGNSITCATDFYLDSAKDGTATIPSTRNTDCCTAKATCAGYASCSAGYKLKANPSNYKGSGNTATLSNNLCCELDATKCAGIGGIVCAASSYIDSSKNGVSVTASNKNTACCSARATCAGYSCSAGYTLRLNAANILGAAGSVSNSLCCAADTNKCAGLSVTCPSGYYQDAAKNGVTSTATDMTYHCCTARATCNGFASASCSAGSSVMVTKCSNVASSCDLATCCEVDVFTCAGIGGISCASSSYVDSAKNGVVALPSTKNSVCCTAKASCSGYACSAGYVLRANSGIILGSGAASTLSNTLCCQTDSSKCAGLGVACASNFYYDSTKAGVAAAASTYSASCCTAKATCSSHGCSAGYLARANPGNLYGSGGVSTLSDSLCCYLDISKCRGITGGITCATNYYIDSGKYGATATQNNKNTVCCTAASSCTGFSCSAGYKLKSCPSSIFGTSDASSLSNGLCCDADTTKCAGIGGISCPTGFYQDTAKHGTTATSVDKNYQCCTEKAACPSSVCPAGYKVKGVMCTSTSSTCNTGTCCWAHPWKCAGGPVSCGTGYYQDTAKNGAAAIPSTKVNVCCTMKATCGGYSACPAGYNLKKTKCSSTASTCSTSTCCVADSLKCAGIGGISCATGYFLDTAKNGMGATASTKNNVCCSPQGECNTYQNCPLGWNVKVPKCPSTASTCDSASCCTSNSMKCGGMTHTMCATGYYQDPTKAGVDTTMSTMATDCCSAKATCSGFACSAGYKLKACPSTIYGTGDTTTLSNALCCDADATKCAGIGGISCWVGYYVDPAKYGTTATSIDKNYQCCTAKASCINYPTCGAGYLVSGTYCTTNSGSCNMATCCEVDPIKCAAFSGITCSAGYYVDSSKYGVVTTESTKTTDCCSVKATCSGYSSCALGYTLRSNPGSIVATGGTSTLSSTLCCIADGTKCAGVGASCAGNYYFDSNKAGAAASASTYNANCCSAKASCSGYSCSSGYTLRLNPSLIYGTGTTSTLSNTMCCFVDTTKCAGIGNIQCPTNYYIDPAKNGVAATQIDKNYQCCSAMATCGGFTSCSAGSNARLTKCSGATSTCNTATCCQLDPWKCAGIGSISCANGFYVDSAKHGTFAIPSTKNTVCCTAKASCNGYVCSAGYKLRLNPATIFGSGGTGTLTNTICCQLDTSKCAGVSNFCTGNFYYDTSKAGVATTANTYTANCCTSRATCSGYGCSPGYVLRSNAAAIIGSGGGSTLSNGLCCIADTTKCAGIGGITCPTGFYLDASKDGTPATAIDKTYQCCTESAKCNSYSACAAGYNTAAVKCTGSSASCDQTTCCELDPWMCKGIGGISCSTGFYLDATKDGTTATPSTKNTVCCTSKASCTGYSCAGGYNLKANPSGILGSGDASTLSTTLCCDADTTKCAGIGNIGCATNYYADPSKYSITTTQANKAVDCCTAMSSCNGYSCPAGYTVKANAANIYASTLSSTLCCTAWASSCLFIGNIACSAAYYPDPAKYGVGTDNTNKNTACCSARATCSCHVCSAGYNLKINPSVIYGTGASSTLSDTLCCDGDTRKCAGIGGVTCPAGYYKDPSKNNFAATAATKNSVCCTLIATCNTYLSCPAGYNQKGIKCSTNSNSCTSSLCCESDAGRCSGIGTINCPAGYYRDSAKGGVLVTSQWASSSWKSMCCTAMASCTSYTCPAGYSTKGYMCSSTSSSCTAATCCETDPFRCAGGSVTCPTGYYKDATKGNVLYTTDSECCTMQASCNSYTSCPIGYRVKATYASTNVQTTSDSATCCVGDSFKCSGVGGISCPTGYYLDSNKNNMATSTLTKHADCCSATVTCGGFNCSAGYMLKTCSSQIYGYGGSLLNGSTSGNSLCCDLDTTKCMGIGGISCPTNYYLDSAKYGTVTSSSTKNSDCCTPKAACTNYYIAHTTTFTTTVTNLHHHVQTSKAIVNRVPRLVLVIAASLAAIRTA